MDDTKDPIVDAANGYLPSLAAASTGVGAAGMGPTPPIGRWGHLLYGGRIIDPALVTVMTASPPSGDANDTFGTLVAPADDGQMMWFHPGDCNQGGFNWSSKDRGIVQVLDGSSTAGRGSGGAPGHEVSRASEAATRRRGCVLGNHRQEPWKAPLPVFIEQLYLKRFGRTQPEVVVSVEERHRRDQQRKTARRAARADRAPQPSADPDPPDDMTL